MSVGGYSKSYIPCSNRAYYYRAQIVIKKNDVPRICAQCGSVDNIELHHIDCDISNNSLENLQPLCKNCHQALHNGILTSNSSN